MLFERSGLVHLGRRWRDTDVLRTLHRREYKLGPHGASVVDPRVWNRASVVLASKRKR